MEDLLEWMRARIPSTENPVEDPWDNLLYKDAALKQMMFVRDKVARRLLDTRAVVISTHTSKSCILPVYRIITRDFTLTMRGNFYDWKITVESEYPINIEPGNLFDPFGTINHVYCEGFKPEWVKPRYDFDKRNFTVELGDEYDVWLFLNLILRRK